jgi:6-pyruvoyltetrahydropterin/6-carboxytetrahydropterin synthase
MTEKDKHFMKYRSTKKYGHGNGLSCSFRQWRAVHSHCSKLHGYSIAFELTFETETLDSQNWCVDFGSLKPVKEMLTFWFDHTTLVASDDPYIDYFREWDKHGLIDMREVPATGCERMAEFVYEKVLAWLEKQNKPDVKLISVQVWEHEANSAIYTR